MSNPDGTGGNTTRLIEPLPESANSIDFDQYQRYSFTAQVLDRMLSSTADPVRILEVGSNVLNLLPTFLDAKRIKVVRCDVRADPLDPKFVLLELGKPLPFEDTSFDAVIALEVLEHMPASERKGFVGECTRVAKTGAVFTCPNGHPKVEEFEQIFSDGFKRKHGVPHPWTAEHKQFGPPTEQEMMAIFQSLGVPAVAFNNAPIHIWLPMLMLHTHLFGDISPYASGLNKAARKNMLLSPPLYYRKLYACARESNTLERLKDLSDPIAVENSENHSDSAVLLYNTLSVMNSAMTNLYHESQRKLLQAEHQRNVEAIRTNELTKRLENTFRELDRRKAELKTLMLQYQSMSLHSTLLNSRIQSMRQSISWKITSPLRRLKALFKRQKYDLSQAVHTPDLTPCEQERSASTAWECSSDDPQFHILGVFRRGWMRIRLKIESEMPSRTDFYFDRGSGYSPVDTLSFRCDEELDAYYSVANTIQCVRCDPVRYAGRFQINHFELESLSKLGFAWRAFLSRLNLARKDNSIVSTLFRWAIKLLTFQFAFVKDDIFGHMPYADILTSARTDYENWFKKMRITEPQRKHLRDSIGGMSARPLISVLVPVYNVPEQYLRPCVESVLNQIYPHWELILVDDCSTDRHIRALLEEYSKKDPRIKAIFRATNGNISAASNTGLEASSGEFVALLDNDDELSEDALLRMAQAICNDPSVDFLYSDEDKIALDGRHCEPFFKPDWSPETLLAYMYTCHLGVYRTTLVREIGGFRSEYDGAQDYDLVLRLALRTQRIKHVHGILYHWRKIPSSTAADPTAKPLAFQRGMNALERNLADRGLEGRVEVGAAAGTCRVRFAIRGTPKVSIIIPSACRPIEIGGKLSSHVSRCVHSIVNKSSYKNVEIIVVDRNQMPSDMETDFAALGVRRISYDFPFNWSHVNNFAAESASGSHLLFLNDDMEVINEDWIEALLEFSQQSEIGAVGAKLYFPDGRLQHVGVQIIGGWPMHPFYNMAGDYPGHLSSASLHRNYIAVTGACLMTRRDVFYDVGRFDEALPLNYNDVDYCLRVHEKGKRIVYTPYCQLVHFESATRAKGVDEWEKKLYRERWNAKYPLDPYYHPHLTTKDIDYSLEF